MQSPSLVLTSAQSALERSLDIVANNVANASTTGFKREGIEFDSLLSTPDGGEPINFVVDRATYRDASTGPIQPTDNPLDVAIQGQGYFSVQMPDGTTAYTRDGAFQIDNQGQLVTQQGYPVLGAGGAPIILPATTTEVNIAADGFVSARVDQGINLAQIGKIAVVKFDNEQQMTPQGNNLYTTTQDAAPADKATIVQGALEQSNVQPILEMTQLIQIQRSYEQASNLISQENQRLDTAINTLSKTTA